MHMCARASSVTVTALVLLSVMTTVSVAASQERAVRRATTAATAKKTAAPHKDFRVPAGTVLTIQLGTDASSASSQLDDPIVGRVSVPVAADGTELIPAGTTVFGAVSNVATADEDSGPGRLELRFNLIEHPETRSRVGIRTTAVRFKGEYVKVKRRGLRVTRPADVRVPHGTTVTATLLEPFTVRLPGAR
jgi:hypothetical protein